MSYKVNIQLFEILDSDSNPVRLEKENTNKTILKLKDSIGDSDLLKSIPKPTYGRKIELNLKADMSKDINIAFSFDYILPKK